MLSVMFDGLVQPDLHHIDILFRRSDSFLRLLLEDVKHVDGPFQFDRIDGSVSVPVLVGDHFEHAAAAEALQGLGVRVLCSQLRREKCESEHVAHIFRESADVLA